MQYSIFWFNFAFIVAQQRLKLILQSNKLDKSDQF